MAINTGDRRLIEMDNKFKAGHIYRLKDGLENEKIYGFSEDGVEIPYFDGMEEIKGHYIKVYEDSVSILYYDWELCPEMCDDMGVKFDVVPPRIISKEGLVGDNDTADMVNSPAHYKLEGLNIESKDVIKSVLGVKGYVHWACGNALKYIFRWEKKNGLEDLKKARKNLDFAIETLEGVGE